MSTDELRAFISEPVSSSSILPQPNNNDASPMQDATISVPLSSSLVLSQINDNDAPSSILPQDELFSMPSSSSQSLSVSFPSPRSDIRQPTVLLHRLPRSNSMSSNFSEQSEISSQLSVITNPAQGELLIFARFEFMNVFRGKDRLLFVHDIEQFYHFRYKCAMGSVYVCRRKICQAKVLIDADGRCTQYEIASHSHPSVKEDYWNILLMQSMKTDCMQSDILRVERMRSVYDRYITM